MVRRFRLYTFGAAFQNRRCGLHDSGLWAEIRLRSRNWLSVSGFVSTENRSVSRQNNHVKCRIESRSWQGAPSWGREIMRTDWKSNVLALNASRHEVKRTISPAKFLLFNNLNIWVIGFAIKQSCLFLLPTGWTLCLCCKRCNDHLRWMHECPVYLARKW